MKPTLSIVLSALALLTFLLWGFHYAGFDLWWDELLSLTEYSLVDYQTTVTAYPDPNNHILLNLVDNLVTRIWGVRDVYEIMDRVALLRWLQWIIALGTLAYVFAVGRKTFGPLGGALGVVFLVSSLPYLNFAMQIRGYNLSMFFVAGLLFHCLCHRSDQTPVHLIPTGAYSFALLYTVPSNIYFLIALGMIILWSAIREARTGRFTLRQNSSLWLLAAIGVGTLLALLAYMPVLKDVVGNRFVTDHPPDRLFILVKRLPQVLNHFMSYRYLLLLVVIPGLYRAARNRTLEGRAAVLPLLALLLLPFLLSFIRNDYAFQRTFIHLSPVFALILAGGTLLAVEGWRRWPLAGRWLPPILGLYALATLGFTHVHIQRRLADNLRNAVREQNILANYYQSKTFRPVQMSWSLAQEYTRRPGRVLMASELDRVAWTFSLEKFDIPSYVLVRSWEEHYEKQGAVYTHVGVFQQSRGRNEELVFFQNRLNIPEPIPYDRLTPVLKVVRAYDPADRYYVITGFGDHVMDILKEKHPGIRVEELNRPGGFRLFLLTPQE